MHGINGNLLPYKTGDLFLITPNDYHSFDLEEVCEFMIVRFAPSYVKSYRWESIDHIECLLYYASHFSGSILIHEADKLMIGNLMQNLQHTAELKSIYSEDLMRHLVNAIIVIAARNISLIKQIGRASCRERV